jgi:hypothetical protein
MHDGKGFGDRAFHFSAFLQFLSKGGKSKLGPRHPLAPLVSGDFAARHLCGFDACAAGECGDACIDVAQRRLRDWFSIILTTEGLDLWALPAAPHTHSLGMNAREDGFYPLSRVWRVGRTKMENRKAGSGCGGCRLARLSRRWR